MKKVIILPIICLSVTFASFGQKLSKKDSRKIVETVWGYVKTNDTASFRKMWAMDGQQWPYHTVPFDVQQIQFNFQDFKSYFDTALAKNMKIDEVECDTVEYNDPHRGFSKYYIKGWFKYSNTYKKGFGFYMDYVNNKWLIRFSPDYSVVQRSGKK
jgi:hypothetical protein